MTDTINSSWQSPPSERPRPLFPRDIPPDLARLIISYARLIVRMPAAEAAIYVRAMEATVVEWKNGGNK